MKRTFLWPLKIACFRCKKSYNFCGQKLKIFLYKIDENALKLQKDEKIVTLEEERDYFRGEALRLFDENKN